MRSHSASTFIQFLTDVAGMGIQYQFRVPGPVLEATLGWAASDGADVTILGTGTAGLIEVLDVPEHLQAVAPEGLAALSFLTDDFDDVQNKRRPCDPAGGPFPEVLSLTEIQGDYGAMGRWRVTFHKRLSNLATLLSNRWSPRSIRLPPDCRLQLQFLPVADKLFPNIL